MFITRIGKTANEPIRSAVKSLRRADALKAASIMQYKFGQIYIALCPLRLILAFECNKVINRFVSDFEAIEISISPSL
jgi:hypothetical protein